MPYELNITKGEWWEPHLSQDDCACNCGYVLNENLFGAICTVDWSVDDKLENGGNPTLEEAKANGILIADAGNTYQKCGMLPSELLEEMNGPLEEIRHMNKMMIMNPDYD